MAEADCWKVPKEVCGNAKLGSGGGSCWKERYVSFCSSEGSRGAAVDAGATAFC